MVVWEFEKYVTDVRGVEETIKKYGVAVVLNVLTKEECKAMFDGAWEFIEHLTKDWGPHLGPVGPILRNSRESWKYIKYLYLTTAGALMQPNKASCAPHAVKVRQNIKIVSVFAELYKCAPEELLASTDAIGFGIPKELIANHGSDEDGPPKKRARKEKVTPLHTDKSYVEHKKSKNLVQSWVTSERVKPGDATLEFLEESHKYHEEFANHFFPKEVLATMDKKTLQKVKKDYFVLTEEHIKFYEDRGCTRKRIFCPAGSLVLWDSRTIHNGASAMPDRDEPDFRNIVYLCYAPRERATEKDLERKRKNVGRTTSHDPIRGRLFSDKPNTYGQPYYPVNLPPAPVLNDLGRKLMGY